MLAIALALAVMAAAQDAPPPVQPAPLPVSLDRIRRGLQRTPTLRVEVPTPEPTFKVTIVEHPYFREVPHQWDWGGGGVPLAGPPSGTGSPALAQVDVLPLLKSAKHAYDEHAAKKDVERELAAFCSTHVCG